MSIPDLLEGLNCCSGNVNSRDCDACPYFNERRCLDKLLEHAAEVINGMRGGCVMMVPELKPCPFCGGEAEFIFKPIIANDPDCRTLVRVRCADCYAQSPYKRNPQWHGWFVDSKKKAAGAWNRRKEDDLR